MCRSKSTRMRWLLGLSVLAVIATTGQMAYGQSGVGLSITPGYTSPVVVGQTLIPAILAIQNSSFGTGPATVLGITMDTVCGSNQSVPCASLEPGVITFSATGTGVSSINPANTSCVGTWTISVVGGVATFTSPSAPLVLATATPEKCTISFTMSVLTAPTGGAASTLVFAPAAATVQANDSSNGTLIGPLTQNGGTTTTIQTCSASVDKQVSCDGTTWFDVTGADDAASLTTAGVLCKSGASIFSRFIAKNTGGALVTSCGVSDTPATGDPLIFLTGTTALSSLAAGASSTPVAGNALTCTLTTGQNGTNTANLAGCVCPVSSGPSVAIATQHDTATIACAGVKIDKEISCNADSGSITWTDLNGGTTGSVAALVSTAADDGAHGCVAPVFAGGGTGANNSMPSNVSAQWFAKSTGNVDLTCTFSDTNTTFGKPLLTSAGTLLASATTTTQIGAPTTAQQCMTAHAGETGGTDTATIVCSPVLPANVSNPLCLGTTNCGAVTAVPVTANDSATFNCCGIQIEKQVSCGAGGSFVPAVPAFDTNDLTSNATDTCTTLATNPVAIQYQIRNAGSTTATCTVAAAGISGGLTDLIGTSVIQPLTNETLTAGQTTTVANIGQTTCNPSVFTGQDVAQLSCACNGTVTSESTANGTQVIAKDAADIICALPPNFNVTKTCVPNTTSAGFTATVTVHNAGPALSCSLSTVAKNGITGDQFFAGDCPATVLPTGTPLGSIPASSFTPNPTLSVGAGSTSSVVNGSFVDASFIPSAINPLATGTVCNVAAVTCTANGTSDTESVAVGATCPVSSGCFTRTPGFWGTHPDVTGQLLPLTVCGITLTTTNAFTSGPAKHPAPFSATEDLCESGADFKGANTTPQQLQLIRQCTSAALNIKASNLATNPSLSCLQADPTAVVSFGACCVGSATVKPVCNNGGVAPSATSPSIDTCIGILDDFNNKFDNTDFPSFLTNTNGANPDQCQIANGNGIVNGGRSLEPGK